MDLNFDTELDDDEISMKAVYNTDYDPELNEVE